MHLITQYSHLSNYLIRQRSCMTKPSGIEATPNEVIHGKISSNGHLGVNQSKKIDGPMILDGVGTQNLECASQATSVTDFKTHISEADAKVYSCSALALTICLFVVAMLVVPRIPQPLSYHDFADKRSYYGIPNFYNVVTNLPFVFVGIMGIVRLSFYHNPTLNHTDKIIYFTFFLFTFLGGLGSGYYHWTPNNATLLWDRLPLTAATMALLAAIVSERVSPQLGSRALILLLILGSTSALHWEYTELQGRGDMRFYTMAQALPVVLAPLVLYVLPSPYTHSAYLWACLGLVGIARLGELLDVEVFQLTMGIVSGHTVKHIALASGISMVLQYLKSRMFK